MQGMAGAAQLRWHTVTIEDLVPAEHFLRKLESILDLRFVYEETRRLYSRKGRPSVDPVVLEKYLLLGYLHGIPSERQIEVQCRERPAFRWYLGLDIDAPVPDHSTISQNRRRRPSFRKVFRRLFEEVVRQCVEAGLVSGKLIATDSTHVKARASRASEYLIEAEDEPGVYWERLDAYEEAAQKDLERKKGCHRKKRVKQIKRDRRCTHRQVSRTDPEAGYLKRPGKPRGMHYLSHQSLDTDHGIILDVAVTPGDASDTVPYLDQLERIHQQVIPVQAATADAIYDFSLAHQVLEEQNITFYVRPIKQHDQTTVEFGKEKFVYDEAKDAYLCPSGKELRLSALNRSSSSLRWVYSADRSNCQSCPLRAQCLNQSRQSGGVYWNATSSSLRSGEATNGRGRRIGSMR